MQSAGGEIQMALQYESGYTCRAKLTGRVSYPQRVIDYLLMITLAQIRKIKNLISCVCCYYRRCYSKINATNTFEL
jgi:hypothetical protein